MASKRELQELQKLLLEVNTLRQQLDKPILSEQGLGNATKSFNGLLNQITTLKSEITDLDSGFGGMAEALKSQMEDWGKITKSTTEANRSMSKLVGLASKLGNEVAGNERLSLKQLKSLETIAKTEQKNLNDLTKKLNKKLALGVKISKEEQSILDNLSAQNKEVGEHVDFVNDLVQKTGERLNLEKRITKQGGLTLGAFKSLKNTLGKIGIGGEFFEEGEENIRNAVESGGALSGVMAGLKSLAVGFAGALNDPLVIIGLIVKGVKFLVGLVSHVRKLTSQVSQTFGIAGEEARNMAHQIESAGVASGDIYHNTQELISAQQELNKQTNLNLDFNEANAKTFRNLSEYMGLGAEKAGALFKISAEMGRPFESIYDSISSTTNELNKSTDDFVQVGAVVDQIANASADTKSSFRGGFEEMVKTAHVAARLGTSMEAIKNASRKTLDFQSSIESEMQAEMMLGKNLNLEKLRHASLTRDGATMAAEQERLVRETMDSALQNQLVLEDTAAALGMSTDEYVTMAEAIKTNSKLGDKQLKQNQATADAMAESGKKAQEFDRSLAAALDGFKQSLLPLAEALEPIFSGVAKALGLVGKFFASPLGKFVGSLAGLAAGGVLVFKAGKSLIDMFTGGGLGKKGTYLNPMIVKDISGGGSDMGNMSKLLKGNLFKYLGNKGGLSRTLNRTMIKTFGKNGFTRFMQTKVFNPKDIGKFRKALNFVAEPLNKLGGKIIPQSGANLTKAFGTNQMSKIQKMSQTGRNAAGQFITKSQQAKAGNMVSKFTRGGDLTSKIASKASSLLPTSATKALTKVGPSLVKGLKVLGPIGAIADLGMGAYKGAGQADLSAEAQKASGVKEGIGKAEATTLGALTGGAEKGSMFTEMVGGEKGSAGDEMLGIGMAAGRGALIGGAIGSVIPVVGTAVGAAVGAVVGTVAEGFKVFSDPNSSLRKGVTEGIDYLGDKTKEFGTALWDTGKDIAKGVGGVVSSVGDFSRNIASKVASSLSESSVGKAASSAWEGTKSLASSAGDYVSSWFANGGVAPGGFRAFANGGTVTQPTLGMVGEGRYNEAIIPLPDGKSVPVQMNGGSKGAGNSEVIALLKELITVVKSGGDIYMDGAKVGKSMVMATSRMG